MYVLFQSDKDSICGESHWKAAQNTARKKAKIDETCLEIARSHNRLVQWAITCARVKYMVMRIFIQTKKCILLDLSSFGKILCANIGSGLAKLED